MAKTIKMKIKSQRTIDQLMELEYVCNNMEHNLTKVVYLKEIYRGPGFSDFIYPGHASQYLM